MGRQRGALAEPKDELAVELAKKQRKPRRADYPAAEHPPKHDVLVRRLGNRAQNEARNVAGKKT